MATLTVPNRGKALIYFHKAQMHAQKRHIELQNCKSCDKVEARIWKEADEFFASLKAQLEKIPNENQ